MEHLHSDILAKEGYPISQEYIKSTRPLTDDEFMSLKKAMDLVDKVRSPFKRLSSITWSFYVFGEGELPFPHTHERHIMLPVMWVKKVHTQNTEAIAKTLVHELIHIFQRFFPLESNMLLMDAWNIQIVGEGKSLLRNNPDLNWIRYAGHGDSEHPFELMAYRLADVIMEGGAVEYLKRYL